MATSGVTASYGSYRFRPVPLVTLNVEKFRTTSKVIGGYYNLTLNGTLFPSSTGAPLTGPKALFEEKNRLMSGLNVDYDEFIVDFQGDGDCAGTSIYGRPRIRSVSFQESTDNWTDRIPYTIELEFTASTITGVEDYITTDLNLESLTTDYSVSFVGPNTAGYWGTSSGIQQYFGPHLEIKRGISAKGLNLGLGTYRSTGTFPDNLGSSLEKTAYQNALDYVGSIATGAPDLNSFTHNNILNIAGTLGSGYSQAALTFRDITTSEEEGTVNVNDTFMVFPVSGTLSGVASPLIKGTGNEIHKVSDTFNFDIADSESEGITTINLNGTIQGYTSYGLGDGFLKADEGSTAIDEARDYLALSLIQNDHLFNRANYLYTDASTTGFNGAYDPWNTSSLTHQLALNPNPISKSFGYNISDGTISYAVSFNNKPGPCNTGVIAESISLTRNKPIPVIATQQVLGRANGPILQSLGTVTSFTQDMSIEAIVVPPSGDTCLTLPCPCPSISFSGAPDYEPVVLKAEAEISGSNAIFRTADNETFDPKIGRYSRSVSWTYTPCG